MLSDKNGVLPMFDVDLYGFGRTALNSPLPINRDRRAIGIGLKGTVFLASWGELLTTFAACVLTYPEVVLSY
ncbi:hypothetical protein BVG80_02210 [Sphingobacteriales bacterium TSM_CSM]|nr:hypothetical protein BVG80_02210 [Sphingobacteriales bacterium TSM_CSM]